MSGENRKQRWPGIAGAVFAAIVAFPEWSVVSGARLLKAVGIITLPDNAATLVGWMTGHNLWIQVPAAIATAVMLSYAFWGTWWRSVRLEPTHLIWIGMGGTVCSVVLLGVGMIWSAQKPTAPGGAQESSTAATFVPQVPKLPTATDREGFRAALGELAGMLDELTRQAAISPDDIATSRPLAQPPYTSAGIPLAKLRERLAAFQELDNRLFATGEGPFFREKPLYRAELLHLMPADTQQKWVGFNVALHNFIDALQLLKDAESPFDREKFQRAEKVAGFSQLPYAIAVRELREWAALVHSRIKATIEAIP